MLSQSLRGGESGPSQERGEWSKPLLRIFNVCEGAATGSYQMLLADGLRLISFMCFSTSNYKTVHQLGKQIRIQRTLFAFYMDIGSVSISYELKLKYFGGYSCPSGVILLT